MTVVIEDQVTHVVIGQNVWGAGPDLAKAKSNFRKQGGYLMKGYSVFEFGPDTEFQGVDQMGFVHYQGPEPTLTEHEPKAAK